MLTRVLNEIALRQSIEAVRRGMDIFVHRGSFFSELISSTSTMDYSTSDKSKYIDNEDKFVEEVAQDFDNLNLPKYNKKHNIIQDEVIEFLKEKIKESNFFARNVVKENIDFYKEDLEDRLKKMVVPSPLEDFTIVERQLPISIVKNVDAIEYSDHNNESLPNIQSREFYIDNEDTDGIIAIKDLVLASCPDNIKGDVALFLSSNPNLSGFYIKLINQGAGTSAIQSKLENQNFTGYKSLTHYDRVNEAYLAYLYVRYVLIGKPPEDLRGISFEDYDKYTYDIKAYLAITMANAIDRINAFINKSHLIFKEDLLYKTVEVHKPIYRKFLEGVGTPEALLGRLFAADNTVTLDDINKKVVDYVAGYKRYETMSLKNSQDKKLDFFKSMAYKSFVDNLAEHKTEYETHSDKTAIDKAKEIISKANLDTLVNLDKFAMEVITLSRFYETSAYELFNYMMSAKSTNPDITPQEAFLYAMIEHVSDFIAAQIQVNYAT